MVTLAQTTEATTRPGTRLPAEAQRASGRRGPQLPAGAGFPPGCAANGDCQRPVRPGRRRGEPGRLGERRSQYNAIISDPSLPGRVSTTWRRRGGRCWTRSAAGAAGRALHPPLRAGGGASPTTLPATGPAIPIAPSTAPAAPGAVPTTAPTSSPATTHPAAVPSTVPIYSPFKLYILRHRSPSGVPETFRVHPPNDKRRSACPVSPTAFASRAPILAGGIVSPWRG